MAKISAIIITKNNEDKIEDCLKSLQWADEIVVVDDYSTDATPLICEQFPNVKFYRHKFEGFIQQKNHATSLTRNKWVLQLDADERVSDEMREAIEKIGQKEFEKYACFEFRRKTYFWGKWIRHSTFYPDYKPRLFNKDRGHWGGINPHDKFMAEGPTKKISADILHFQDWDLKTYVERTIRYSRISAEEYYRSGRRAKWHHYTIRPIYTFVYRYFFRLGILDGIQGFVISAMGALGTFMKYMFLYELQKNGSFRNNSDTTFPR